MGLLSFLLLLDLLFELLKVLLLVWYLSSLVEHAANCAIGQLFRIDTLFFCFQMILNSHLLVKHLLHLPVQVSLVHCCFLKLTHFLCLLPPARLLYLQPFKLLLLLSGSFSQLLVVVVYMLVLTVCSLAQVPIARVETTQLILQIRIVIAKLVALHLHFLQLFFLDLPVELIYHAPALLFDNHHSLLLLL